ncbi:MAG: hypothetical protein BWY68_00753 [bacterium ADurb.Bin400]|nr:MAG: hypothetical protein BWY68_00753 [bacterium ADurb.Bin400]
MLHHLPGKEMRLRFLQEAYRVLRPGGKLVLTVWYLWNKPEMMREIVKYGVFSLMGIESLDFGDVLIPFKDAEGEVMVKRYLHCFTKKELQVTVKEAGFEVVHQEVQSRGTRKVNENLLIIAKR